MKHFYEFIVITPEEEEEIRQGKYEITDCEYDDYRYWGLYDFDQSTLIFFGDNIHNNGIEEEINAFFKGLNYVDIAYSLDTGYLVMENTSITAQAALSMLSMGTMYDEVL